METHRIYYANQSDNELKQLEIYKRRVEDTIQRCRAAANTDAVRQKINTLKDKLTEYEQQIEQKQQEVKDIRMGYRDDDIKKIIMTDSHVLNRKTQENLRKKNEAREELANAKDKADKYFQKGRTHNRPPTERNMSYEYDRYIRNCNKIPDYMIRKLASMPNNKGYIWRGIWLLGHRKEERDEPTIMFERRGKDILHIHEYDNYQHRIYEKKGKAKKILIRTINRTRKSNHRNT